LLGAITQATPRGVGSARARAGQTGSPSASRRGRAQRAIRGSV
jgi:hypothetical protein